MLHVPSLGSSSVNPSVLINSKIVSVNLFHNNLMTSKSLANCLRAFALSQPDDFVEGFIHDSFPIIGIMWHPEPTPLPISIIIPISYSKLR